jgi:cyclopropane fatty-acyl-phospholipid synthase-like methyltransferase
MQKSFKQGWGFTNVWFEILKYYSTDLVRYFKEQKILNNTFGKAHLKTIDSHTKDLRSLGYSNIKVIDVTQQTLPTLDCWRDNIKEQLSGISKFLSTQQIYEFLTSCTILETLFKKGILSYCLIRAQK